MPAWVNMFDAVATVRPEMKVASDDDDDAFKK
jgi:hypothetical protein